MSRTIWIWVLALAAACGGSTPRTTGPEGSGGGGAEPRPDPGPRTEERAPLGTLQVVEMHADSPTISIRVVFDAGSSEDPTGREGITQLTAALMAEGGAGQLSFREISERLYPMSAAIDATVDRDQTAFAGRVHRDHLDAFYEIFRDVLTAPQMNEDDYQRVKTQQESALLLELRGNDDEELGKQLLQAMLYEGHPYAHPMLGTERGLAAITLDDVRAHRTRVFCAGRATVGLAGGYPDGFVARVRQDLERLAFETCVGARVLAAPAAVEAPRIWIADKADAGAVAVSMGMPLEVTRAHPDYPALVLATAYLGQHRQFAGVLMQKMRGDRGLNYGDYAYTEHFAQDGWSTYPLPNTSRRQQYWSIWVRPVPPEKAHFATRMAVYELGRFVERGMAQEDVDRIRAFIDGYYALYLQTESRRLGFAIDDRYYDVDQAWLERLRAAWRSLTAEQINAAIRRHLDPRRLQIAIVAPNGADLAERLASDAPSPIQYATPPPERVTREDETIVRYPLRIPRDRIRLIPIAEVFR